MKTTVRIIALLMTLGLLVSCASTSTPSWVNDPYVDHPKDLYVCAIGYGDTESQADNEARLQLASQFGVSVRSQITNNAQQQVFGTQDNLSERLNQFFSSESSISFGVEKLFGLTIESRTEVDGRIVSLAVMEKRTTADYYFSRLEPTKENISNALNRVVDNIGKLKGVRDSAECIRLCDEYNTQVAICNYLTNNKLPFMSLAEFYELQKKAVGAVVIEVDVIGDDSGSVKPSVAKALTGFGFLVSNGTTDPSARASVTINWRESAGTGVASSFIFAYYNVDVSLVDIAGNETVMVFSFDGKEGHQSYENAKGRALTAIADRVEAELGSTLEANYGF